MLQAHLQRWALTLVARRLQLRLRLVHRPSCYSRMAVLHSHSKVSLALGKAAG